MPQIKIPGINLPLLTGPLVLGYMFSYGLWGVLIVQMYIYHINFPKDQRGIKIFVWCLFLLETIFTVFTTIAAWNQYGPGWGDVSTLTTIDWAWSPLPQLNGFIAAMVQSFYIWRIWSLTRNLWIALAIELVAVAQATLAFYYGTYVGVKGRGVDKLFALTPVISAWLVCAAVCDVLITVVIVFVLQRANNRTKFKQTTSAITRLIRFTVETGLITSFMAIVELILWITSHEINVHFIGFLVLGKLYSNALVATLNSRAAIFSQGPGGNAYVGSNGGASSAPQATSAFWDDGGVNTIQSTHNGLRAHTVHVSRQTNVVHDNGHEMIVVQDLKGAGDYPANYGHGHNPSLNKYSRDF